MGCIQPKKTIKIGSSGSREGSKNESNNIVIHNIKKAGSVSFIDTEPCVFCCKFSYKNEISHK